MGRELLQRMAGAADDPLESGRELRRSGIQVDAADSVRGGQLLAVLQREARVVGRRERFDQTAHLIRVGTRFAQVHPVDPLVEQLADDAPLAGDERGVGYDDQTHHPPQTALMTVIFI